MQVSAAVTIRSIAILWLRLANATIRMRTATFATMETSIATAIERSDLDSAREIFLHFVLLVDRSIDEFTLKSIQ